MRPNRILRGRGTPFDTRPELTPVDVGPRESLYVRALRAFHAAMRGEGEPAVTGEDGIKSLAVALAVRQSAASGRAVKVAA